MHLSPTARAGILGTDVADDPNLGGLEVELLRDLLADPHELCAVGAAHLRLIRQVMNDINTRQVGREPIAPALMTFMRRNGDALRNGCVFRLPSVSIEKPRLIGIFVLHTWCKAISSPAPKFRFVGKSMVFVDAVSGD